MGTVLAVLLVAFPAAATAAAPGAPDATFGAGGGAILGAGSQLFGVAVQPDGQVVAAGQKGGNVLVQRFSSAGKPNGTFSGPSGYARSVALQPDGKIVIAGTSGGAMYVERLTAGLTPDGSFGSGGTARAFAGTGAVANGVAVGPDGTIVAGGSLSPPVTALGAAKFSASGAPQWAQKFNFGSNASAAAVAVQADGKIVLIGSQTQLQTTNGLLVRLTAGGSPDGSFHGNGAFTYHVPGGGYTALTSVALQTNGQIVAGGITETTNSFAVFVRVNANGSLDGGFGSGGSALLPSAQNVQVIGDPIGAYGVGIAGGGRIVGAGNFENTGVEVDGALWALTPGGAAQGGFGSGGTVRSPAPGFEACALAVAPSGELVVVGQTVTTVPDATPCTVNGSASGFAARYGGFGPPPGGGGGGGTPALKSSLQGVPGSVKTSTVAKHGLKVGVSCNEACTVTASLGLSAGTAKRLHIRSSVRKCTKVKGKTRCSKKSGYFALTIATARGSLGGAGTASLTLRLGKAYASALGKQKSVSVSLQATATSTATHKSITSRKTITFKR